MTTDGVSDRAKDAHSPRDRESSYMRATSKIEISSSICLRFRYDLYRDDCFYMAFSSVVYLFILFGFMKLGETLV